MSRFSVQVLMLTSVGCSATLVPPPVPVDPVLIAITDYGRHSSLLLPDEAGTGSIEYAFGDWNWFAAGRNTPCDGVSALFASGQATLGRMEWPIPPDSPDLKSKLEADRVMVMEASARDVAALRERLERRFEARLDEQVYNETMKLWFVPDDERYRLWNNCNHVTAGWLRELGFEIRGSPYTSKFKLAVPAPEESERVALQP